MWRAGRIRILVKNSVYRGENEYGIRSSNPDGEVIDPVVWDDIERFLRYPGDILEELKCKKELDVGAAIVEAERVTLERAMINLARR